MFNPTGATAALPAQDFERAKSFYADRLGMKPVRENEGEALYQVGATEFLVFPSAGKASGDHTQMGLAVDDLTAAMKTLRDNGVVFEEYDMPGLKTVDGVVEIDGEKAAWFKDSEGNVISLFEQVP